MTLPQEKFTAWPFGFSSRIWFFSYSALVPGKAGLFFQGLGSFTLFLLVVFSIPLLWRWLLGHILWKVRNRLIVTYLLMGLAPVVLFVSLALILLYVFSGQFAIFAATTEIESELAHISSQNRAFAIHAAHMVAANPKAASLTLSEIDDSSSDHPHIGIRFNAFENGRPLPLIPAA